MVGMPSLFVGVIAFLYVSCYFEPNPYLGTAAWYEALLFFLLAALSGLNTVGMAARWQVTPILTYVSTGLWLLIIAIIFLDDREKTRFFAWQATSDFILLITLVVYSLACALTVTWCRRMFRQGRFEG